MISQVLFMKVAVEAWRSTNVWGSIFWMFNEVWPTGGWGSIEYGSPVPGQVVGGRWKPLQYILMNSMFADRMAGCNSGGSCFVVNSVPFLFEGTVVVRLINMLTGTNATMVTRVSLSPGAGTTRWFCADAASGAASLAAAPLAPLKCVAWSQTPAWKSVGCSRSGDNCAFVIKVFEGAAGDGDAGMSRAVFGGITAMSTSFVTFQPPKATRLPKAVVTASVGELVALPSPLAKSTRGGTVPITLSTNATALYVVLTTRADGRFSDNAFLLEAGMATVVDFLPWGPLDLQLLKTSLRVEHMAENLV